MSTPVWNPGTLYLPGDLVRPRSGASVTQDGPLNPSFESNLTDWTQTTEGGAAVWTASSARAFDGTKSAVFVGGSGTFQGSDGQLGILINNNAVPVVPGQLINGSGRMTFDHDPGSFQKGGVRIYWYDATNAFLSYSIGPTVHPGTSPRKGPPGTTGGNFHGDWVELVCNGVAPESAAFARFSFIATGNGNGGGVFVDFAGWDYTFSDTAGTPSGLVFRATQSAPGFSGADEPVWPTTVGGTVVDNEVVWEGTASSRIVWTATPILVSGDTEPTWPTDPTSTVADNTISWYAMPWTVDDANAPHSKIVAIATSKIFAGDNDIVPFSATVNPLDWSTANDAGYLPFGLQTYGSQPVTLMGLYRGNLLVFNAQGFQMWQVGEDPADHALLDAVPVGSIYHRAGVPIANDFVFLTDQGIRSVGIAAASTNLQAGDFGKAIDPLVIPKVKEITADTDIPGVPAEPNLTVGDCTFGQYGFDVIVAGTLSPAIVMSGYTVHQAFFDTSGPPRHFVVLVGNGGGANPVQGLFTTVYVQTTEGIIELDSSDASFINPNAGEGQWQWDIGSDDTFWDTVDIGSEFRLSFDVPIVLPIHVDGLDPIGLFVPDLGQYWLICGDEAFVLTSNGTGKDSMSWSRYTFPSDISDWTILDGDLYLRSGDLVWRVDEDAIYDDEVEDSTIGGDNIDIEGYVAWPYLDLGRAGVTKSLAAFDLVIEGEVNVQFGFDQSDDAFVTDAYTLTGDTLPGSPIAMPISAPSFQMRLTFAPGQFWSWNMSVLYIDDNSAFTI